MLDSKLAKIKDLIEQKQRIDEELSVLLGEKERPKRGRPSKEKPEAVVQSEQ